MASFYVASSLSNAHNVSLLIKSLQGAGHVCTFDWTVNAALQEKLGAIAADEINGVIAAEFVFVLLPGGYGTHVELGVAMTTGATVFVCYDDKALLRQGGKYCAFHWHPDVKLLHYVSGVPMLGDYLAEVMKAFDYEREEDDDVIEAPAQSREVLKHDVGTMKDLWPADVEHVSPAVAGRKS